MVAVHGPDAVDFLQNIVTCDVETLKAGEASLGALLTPQGKIIVDFLIVRDDGDGFLIDMTQALTSDLIKRLTLYRLRAKVEITEASAHLAVAAVWGGIVNLADGLVFADPRSGDLGYRAFLPKAEAAALLARAGATLLSPEAYDERRIGAAIPEGGKDYTLGDTFPHEADLDALGGVSFGKGCYVGQEVVSRMQHRASVRKRVVPVSFELARPLAGIEVRAGERPIGYMGSAVRARGLAMLRLDLAAEALAAGETLDAGGVTLTPEKPGWAGFEQAGLWS